MRVRRGSKTPIKKIVTLSCLLVMMVSMFACAGSKGSVPSNVTELYVPPFRNQTDEPGLENIMTDETIQQFLADGSLDIVSSANKASAILVGTLTQYKRMPLIYNDQDVVQQYKLRLTMNLMLRDAQTGEPLWRKTGIFRETTYSDIIAPVETEFEAKDRVIRKLARDAVTSTVEGWPYLDDVN